MIIEILIVGMFGVCICFLYRKISSLKKKLKEALSLVKSKEVHFGKSFENFIPFTSNFPGDKEKAVFLGMPIDYLVFENDCIKFIECKTGQSQLSSKQKNIKRLVEAGKVEWHEVRY